MGKKLIYLVSVFFVLGLALADVVKAAPVLAKGWEFTTDLEGWVVGNNVSGLAWQVGGYMGGSATTGDPYLRSPANLEVGITNAPFVKVRLKNGTAATRGQIYFVTNTSMTWNEAKHKDFPITANDTGYTEYTIDMSTVAEWTGTLNQLRLDPAVNTGPFSVDYIRIQYLDVPFVDLLATEPSPVDKATDVARDATLSWTAGPYGGAHDVYFGTTFADVNNATRADTTGILASQGQADTTFDPVGLFAYGQTYYWRVDEVNAAPDNTIWKGQTWSFTAEPYSYPITKITATASSASANMGPEKTVNGSGLNAADQHSTTGDQMWLSTAGDPAPWIQYTFDKAYRLDRMLAWNSNQLVETMIGFGAKSVKVEYSLDGTTWTALGDFEFAQATGLPTYTANTTVDFHGAVAQYVKLSLGSNWGGIVKQSGLSEVRFLRIPVVADHPIPAPGAANLDPHVTLSWRPGREAASHQVLLGTDPNRLAPAATVTQATYTADLDLGQSYYWQVVEVNEAAAPTNWEGPVWSFSTVGGLVVDDMESYGDDMSKNEAIFQTWIDGFDNPQANGAVVGNTDPPFANRDVFFGGQQSMPLAYDNSAGAPYSEAVRTFDTPQDWTKYQVKSLSLYFFGAAGNTGQLYLKINGTKVLYSGAAADLAIAAWQPWVIDLAATGASLPKVTKLAIGVDGAGAKGTLLIDDIRLYPAAAKTITPADPGTKGLIAQYKLDGDAKDAIGGHGGTLNGAPAPFVPGKFGQAYNVTDDQTYVSVPYSADLGMNTFTVSVWVNLNDLSAIRGILGTRFNGDNTFDLKADSARIHADIGSGTAWLNTTVDVVASKGGVLSTGVWHHLAYVVDNAGQAARMYIDGALAATATFTGTPLFMKSGQSLGIGSDYSGAVERMRGMIDEVRLYNRALSDAEVAALAGRTGAFFQAP